jgi:hypothetical protein
MSSSAMSVPPEMIVLDSWSILHLRCLGLFAFGGGLEFCFPPLLSLLAGGRPSFLCRGGGVILFACNAASRWWDLRPPNALAREGRLASLNTRQPSYELADPSKRSRGVDRCPPASLGPPPPGRRAGWTTRRSPIVTSCCEQLLPLVPSSFTDMGGKDVDNDDDGGGGVDNPQRRLQMIRSRSDREG